MKILVTGATGFIGSHVLDQLVDAGHSVVVTARDAKKAAKFPWFNKVKFIAYDLNDASGTQNLYDFFDKPDLLIHLAWEGLPNYRSQFHLEKNLPMQSVFLYRMITGGLRSLTVTGTCLEYGLQEGPLEENMPAVPIVAYAQAKKYLQEYLLKLQSSHDFSFKWVRLFYTYGQGQNENALLSQLDKALERGDAVFNMSGGQQQRDYLPVEKLAEHLVKIALQEKVTGIINGCSGKSISIQQLVEEHLRLKKRSIELKLGHYPYLDYEPMAFWGDTKKLDQALHG